MTNYKCFYSAHVSREEITDLIGFRPRNIAIYQQSLVHKSVQKVIRNLFKEDTLPSECAYMRDSNERLEYLGDAVLNLAVASKLYRDYSGENEGFLTRIRTKLVRGTTLAYLAKELDLGKYILMSPQVTNINGKDNDTILENAYESIIGAIYLDLGFSHAERFIYTNMNKISLDEILKDDNYKDILLRYAQANYTTLPIYNIIDTSGPPHNRMFKISVELDGEILGEGEGRQKKEAEQLAAQQAINILQISP
jgi:ribonuclease-3